MVNIKKIIKHAILSTNIITAELSYSSLKKVSEFVKKTCGIHSHKPDITYWKFQDYVLENFLLWFPFKINKEIIINGEPVKILPHTVNIFRPGTRITHTPALIKDLHVYSMRFNIPDTENSFKYFNFTYNNKLPQFPVKKEFEKLFRCEKEKDLPYLNRKIFLLTILKKLAENNKINLTEDFFLHSNELYKLNLTTEYIKQNINKKIYISTLSELVGINKSTLIKLYKKHLQVTPLKYINTRKIMAAKKLLAENNEIKEVAAILGFADIYSFMKIFKKYEKCTPAQFVRKIKKGNFISKDTIYSYDKRYIHY